MNEVNELVLRINEQIEADEYKLITVVMRSGIPNPTQDETRLGFLACSTLKNHQQYHNNLA